MKYTLYHIKGVKWGCTQRPIELRLKEQGYTLDDLHDTILVDDENDASDLEKELNIRDGYPWNDSQDYRVVSKARSNITEESNRRGADKRIEFYKDPKNREMIGKRTKKALNQPHIRKKKSISMKKHWDSVDRKERLKNVKRGEASSVSKYTEEQARFVKKHYFKQKNQYDTPPKGKLTISQIMKEINVTYDFIRDVTIGKTWKHIQ